MIVLFSYTHSNKHLSMKWTSNLSSAGGLMRFPLPSPHNVASHSLEKTRKDDRVRSYCCNVANNIANAPPNYSLLTTRCSSVPILLENFACGIRNPGLWNLENSSRDPESH